MLRVIYILRTCCARSKAIFCSQSRLISSIPASTASVCFCFRVKCLSWASPRLYMFVYSVLLRLYSTWLRYRCCSFSLYSCSLIWNIDFNILSRALMACEYVYRRRLSCVALSNSCDCFCRLLISFSLWFRWFLSKGDSSVWACDYTLSRLKWNSRFIWLI